MKEIPEGWQKIASGSQASVFSNDRYFLKLLPKETWFQRIKIIFNAKSFHVHDGATLIIQKERKMGARGFSTPNVVAHGVVCNRPFLVTRSIPGKTLRQMLPHCKRKVKFSLVSGLADEIARMHNSGIYHGDLNANNILVAENKQGKPLFCFLDNEKSKFYRKIPNRKAERNLSQLNYLIIPKVVNKTDRLRFLITYLKKRKIAENRKKWWNNILNRFQKRRKRKNAQ